MEVFLDIKSLAAIFLKRVINEGGVVRKVVAVIGLKISSDMAYISNSLVENKIDIRYATYILEMVCEEEEDEAEEKN